MRIKCVCILIFIFILCLVPFEQPQAAARPIPFVTIDKGEISYYRYSNPRFKGAEIVIKNENAWKAFWGLHTQGIEPQPPVPKIDFATEMVIVCILGYQTSGGGPSTRVLKVTVNISQKLLHILIEENEKPGMLTVITNPYHIIKLRRINLGTIMFEHKKK